VSVPTSDRPPGDGDRQAAFATTLADEWVRAGVRHVVVCPGSRSTPLALAVAAEPRLAVHLRLDERSAGFTALGVGLATGAPAVVVVTSGTAAAELHAAVVEADLARVPMVVCTADRPPELRDVGAPQTIDQTHLYGRSVRWFADPGVPDEASRPSWRSLASRSVAEAVSGPAGPGPVHLNLPFREPLLGDSGAGGVPAGRPEGAPWHRVDRGAVPPAPGLVEDLVAHGIRPGARGIIVAGAGCGSPSAVIGLAEALSWPVLADPRSGLRVRHVSVVGAADGILRAPGFVAGHRPDTVLALGGRWASKVVTSFVAGAPVVVVDPWGAWPDPERAAPRLVRCDPTLLCEALTAAVARPGGSRLDTAGAWPVAWERAEARARRVIYETSFRADGWDEPVLAHRLVAALPAGAPLVVSSSMPVRDVEAFGAPRADPPRVLVNRGANGIDGVVSTAVGVALAAGPTVALVGDLAFLHDVSALVDLGGESVPLTVVVADNGGGGIFSFLPPATALDPPMFERLFGTPPSADVAAVAAGFGWEVEEVDGTTDRHGLDRALERARVRGGHTVVRVHLPDRAANVAAHERINAAVVAVVDGTGGPGVVPG
jgi:2-succinyl-5-enolpyruvyl-6-hydroxy-3-cyclohexene-1-carboxylate synthase